VRPSTVSFAGLATLLGAGCTTIIGLPDLPDATAGAGSGATGGGTASTAGTASEVGDAGSTDTGGRLSGGGKNGSSTGGNSNAGSSAGGNSNAGSSTGGNSTGGTGPSGMCPLQQKLCGDTCTDLTTDKDHCGDCKTTCDSACSVSRCYTKLAEEQVVQFAVDASHVYFTGGAGNVSRVPRLGGKIEVLALSKRPTAIALDQNNVYWIEQGLSFEWSLQKLPLVGGAGAKPLATGIDAGSLAVDANYVYCSIDDSAGSGAGSIARVPIAGGAMVTLASAQLNNGALAIDATYVYWVNLGDGSQPHNTDGSVMRVPKAGGTAVPLAGNVDGPRALALAGNFVYFGNMDSIRKVPTSGGAVSTVTTTTGATALAADSSSIYARGTVGLSPLLQLTLAGVEQATLAATGNSRSIVVDGGVVFWADPISLNSIMKVP
jgi:hypothetical protein